MAQPDLPSIKNKLHDLRPELTSFLQALVRTPSLPAHEASAQHLLADELRHLGLTVEIMPTNRKKIEHHPAFCDDGFSFENRFNVVARWNRTNGPVTGRSLILNGHIDVVPPGDQQLWKHGPWSGLVQNGKLYGRGACDMKGGIVAALFALKALEQLGYLPAADIIFESVVGEESGGVGTLTAIVNGVTADAAIIGEPTALKICPVQSGALTFRL
ncbi:MAG: M20/M25/M40 family metallo-hydrolase, partial [Rhodospirillales bacterium]|nr:M20/M25/M40 family metallo-hydrolase [Acetobacter sp.]